MSLSPGTRLGPYEITSAIGAGGMGEVYRAHDTGKRFLTYAAPTEMANTPITLIQNWNPEGKK